MEDVMRAWAADYVLQATGWSEYSTRSRTRRRVGHAEDQGGYVKCTGEAKATVEGKGFDQANP
jgi:hypothetical protein